MSDVDPISILDWVTGKAGSFVVGAIGAVIALTATASRKSSSLVEVKTTTINNAAEIAALKGRMDALSRDYTTLSVSVAALPTRSELTAIIASLRDDIKTLINLKE